MKNLPLFFLLSFFLTGCFYFISPLRKAEKALKIKDCETAWKFFMESKEKPLNFAQKAAPICAVQQPQVGAWFYDHLSFQTKAEGQTNKAQQKTRAFKEKSAKIYFEQLRDFEKALERYSSLAEKGPLEAVRRARFSKALCFFELGKWKASLKEINTLLKTSPAPQEVLFLKARVFLMQKKYLQAEKMFKKIQKEHPVFFKKKEVFNYLSFIYESQRDLEGAIKELEHFRSTSEFLSDRIKRLKIRKSRQYPARL